MPARSNESAGTVCFLVQAVFMAGNVRLSSLLWAGNSLQRSPELPEILSRSDASIRPFCGHAHSLTTHPERRIGGIKLHK